MGKKRMLFVEDDDNLLSIVTSVLAKKFDVVGASNGVEAWEYLKKVKFDYIILDICLPMMDGLELLERMRNNGDYTKVIIATGKNCCESAERCADLSVNGYIKKPYTTNDIIDKINSLPEFDVSLKPALKFTLKGNHPKLRKAEKFIQQNYHVDIRLDGLASNLGISGDYLAKLFKRETSQSYIQYLNGLRVEKAKQLIANRSVPISEVMELCGFNTAQHFFMQFKKYTGQTPNSFRKENLKERSRMERKPHSLINH